MVLGRSEVEEGSADPGESWVSTIGSGYRLFKSRFYVPEGSATDLDVVIFADGTVLNSVHVDELVVGQWIGVCCYCLHTPVPDVVRRLLVTKYYTEIPHVPFEILLDHDIFTVNAFFDEVSITGTAGDAGFRYQSRFVFLTDSSGK
jgi:hypothetical protein